MMKHVSSLGRKQAQYLLLLMALMLSSAVSAEERARIEIVPDIPHSLSIESVAVSSDGARLVSGGADKTMKLWDIATGRLLRTFEGHQGWVNSVAFSPDGSRILSGSGLQDHTLRLWDAASGKLIRSWKAHSRGLGSVAFSPDGALLLSAGEKSELNREDDSGALSLWDAASGQLIRVFEHSGRVTSAAFSLDGTRIISSGDAGLIGRDTKTTLKLWDTATGRLIRTFEGHSDALISSAAFSPNANHVASVNQRELKLWDAATGQLIHTLQGNPGYSIAFSPDGTRLLSGGHRAQLWDVASGRLLITLAGPDRISPVKAVAFLPDGRYLVTADDDLRLWDAASGQLVRTFAGQSAGIESVAFSPDGGRLLSAGRDNTLLWDAASGQLTRTFKGHKRWGACAAFSPDGTRLLSSGGDDMKPALRLWDVGSGQLIRSFEGHQHGSNSVAFSPDGTRVLSGSLDGTIKLWEAESGQLVRNFEGHNSWVYSVTFSPDGTRMLSGGQGDKAFKLWDITTGQALQTPTERDTHAVAFSPKGTHLLTGSDDGLVTLWDAADTRRIRTFREHSGPVGEVAFSPDGSQLLSSSRDKTVKLWNAASGKLIRSFEGHQGWVNSAAFSPDGTRVLSGSSDTTVRLWDTATGEQLAMLLANSDGEWLVITPEGFFDASANGAGILTVVRGLDVFGIDQFYQALYRPDLVREKLAGDPGGKVKEAAAKLDLAKLLDSGRAPQLAITSHQPQDSSATDLVTMEARLIDQGGGIGRAEWRINGITVGVVEKTAGAPGQPVRLRQTMALDPGENTIELTAYNGADLVAAVPARVRITWTSNEPSAPPRLFVMVVGINDYLDSALKLAYAVPDATTLASALEKAGHGLYQDVIVTKVLDTDATAAGLDAVFADLATKVRPRDVFVFFAAGHGKTHDGRYFFIPHDMRYHTEASLARGAIGQDRLQAWFARIPARKAVLMFDTCEAGSLAERRGAGSQSGASRGLEQKAALGRLIQATGRATLTASTAKQEAYEGHGGHGVFTFAVLDALGRADTNNNGLVELAELIQHVDGLVPAITEKHWGAKQYPQMDAYGSNFSVARQIATLVLDQGDAIIIPTKPTHVSTEVVPLFQDKGKNAAADAQLQPFTIVTVVKSEPGWLLVARDGKLLGYAPEAKLHKLN
jgi:WD40 repeat protein